MRLLPTLKKRPPAPPPPGSPPRVLVACPDHAPPAGGVRQLYLLVDALRSELGLDARVFHQRTGFRPVWFRADTPIVYADATAPGPADTLVLPEVFGAASRDHPGVRKIIFNQNAYYTFSGGYELVPAAAPLRPSECGVVGILGVSDDNLELIRHAFPETPTARVRYHIDPALFHPREPKRPRLAFMPRKHPDEARQVLNLLALRGALDGFEVLALEGLDEAATAEALRSSLVFLSFGYPEGCPLPPAEAMASGCLVIGYHGMGAREYLRPDLAWPIATGHILEYARAVETVLAQWRRNPAPLAERAARAAEFIHREFSREAHLASVRAAWRALLPA